MYIWTIKVLLPVEAVRNVMAMLWLYENIAVLGEFCIESIYSMSLTIPSFHMTFILCHWSRFWLIIQITVAVKVAVQFTISPSVLEYHEW